MSLMPDEQPTPQPERVDETQQRAIIPAPPVPSLAALASENLLPALLDEETQLAEICIIPGSGVPEAPVLAPARQRPLRLHVMITLLGLGGLLAAALCFAPLTEAASGSVSPLSALASSFLLPTPRPYFEYRVQTGDTFERIAAHFKVALGGIYELNHLYAGQEAQVGEVIHVPTNARYGAAYVAPPMPYLSSGASIGGGNIVGNCLFCSAGGWTNGPGKPCDAASQMLPVDPTKFGLLNPNPGSQWVRGFTWSHNGVDLTSGQYGTPLVAAQTGVVIFAGWDPFGAGYAVKINHCGGLATAYGHMEKLLVAVGQPVQAGQTIGLQGATGTATGPHVHFMTWWDNVPFDPLCVYASLDGVSATQHYGGCPTPQSQP